MTTAPAKPRPRRATTCSSSTRRGGAPLLSIYGGKITTYRRLAEEALERLAPYLRSAKAREGWTGKWPLPGGDLGVSGVDGLIAELQRGLSLPQP